MTATDKYLTYRGNVQAVQPAGKQLAFVTLHPEKRPGAVYRLQLEKRELLEFPLPCGGLSLAVDGATLWIGGDDAQLYQLEAKDRAPKPLKLKLDNPATALALLSEQRLAALCGKQLAIVDRDSGKQVQSFDLEASGTALAADPSGEWLVVGTSKGQVTVFDGEGKPAFQPSETAKLHEAAVTALLFEPEELRFLSAGADQKLLLTHARGKLEPEDRGRGGGHKDQLTAIVHAPGERFITGGRDKACKTWTRAGASRPATLNETIPAVTALAIVEVHERPHLVVAGQDNTLRLFLLDAGGRFGAAGDRFRDAYARAASLLEENDTGRRGEALHALAEYDDRRAVEMLAARIGEEPDHALRLRATQLLTQSAHSLSAKLLEPLLDHDDSSVRLEALSGLRAKSEKDDWRPLEKAIDVGRADVGAEAVKALEPLAKKDDQARHLLIKTLDAKSQEVRRTALLSLENVLPKKSPEATLIAARAKTADTRRLAIIRGYQRKLLEDSRVQAVIRRGGEDRDADVRQTAFLVGLLSRDKLAKAVRERDATLHRQLFELETFELEAPQGAKAKEPPKTKAAKFSLASSDYEPLLSAMSSRAMDTCLRGARCLALLGDPRAFGLLLQLSREPEASARVQVCQALAALEDERALQRLETLLDDRAAEVRDAAYSAVAALHSKAPLEAAGAGLGSRHSDIRRRGLKSLIAGLRGSKAKKIPAQAHELMLRALNDSETGVRGEAFKSALNLNIAGDNVATLQFVLQSVHASVRREVLTEAMAQDSQPWAWQLLLDLLNDPAQEIRGDAYEHLIAKTKGRDVAPMQSALQSRYVDIRKRATQSLVKLKTNAAQQALVAAIDDPDEEVRGTALKALIAADAEDVLRTAMESRHLDVRLQAASARAFHNDPAARKPLLDAATLPRPEKKADQEEWLRAVLLALAGLEVLADPNNVEPLVALLESDVAEIRKGAADALIGSAREKQVGVLRNSLQHEDAEVRFRVALALALCGETIAMPIVFSPEAGKVLEEKQILIATVTAGSQAENRLLDLLDSSTLWIRNAALLVLLMRDWRAHDGTPARLLSALAAKSARVRLAAARALTAFGDDRAMADLIGDCMNDRGNQKPWKISADQVGKLASLLVWAEPHCQARTLLLLETLAHDKQDDWDFGWRLHAIRYADQLALAEKQVSDQAPTTARDELEQLAFGTYLGLVREQAGQDDRRAASPLETHVMVVRQTAIRRLMAMVAEDDRRVASILPVMIQALGDPLQEVRSLAFEQLALLGLDVDARAEAGLECGHNDLAVAGLKLLTESAGAKGKEILQEVVRTRADILATEAAGLLKELAGLQVAAEAMLESPSDHTRALGVRWLAADEAAKSRKLLRAAVKSRFEDVRRLATLGLADCKDKDAFAALTQLLQESTDPTNYRLINAFAHLGDPRAADVLLDRIENESDRLAHVEHVFVVIGRFRHPEHVERLSEFLERKAWRDDAANAILLISGHDQTIEDPWDDLPDRRWLEKQHARHDDVLATLLERCLELGMLRTLADSLDAARWSLSKAVDPLLAVLATHADESLRQNAVVAIGWRLKERDGPADPLLTALEHRDPTTKFLAAEGLARAGRREGLPVLLSAVELLSDLNLRQRAVLALGELADEQALELLLKLVADDAHALQSVAAEAIGHLGKSDKADKIFELLERLASSTSSATEHAVIGLRWLNTPPAWNVIRQKVRDEVGQQWLFVEQLGYNDDPATRDLLLELLKGSQWVHSAMPAARRLFGDESLEPDYAVMEAEYHYTDDSSMENEHECLRRVCERGEAERIFAVLPKAGPRFDLLAFHLLHREPLPEESALAALRGPHPGTVEVAAGVLGWVAKKTHAKAVSEVLSHWQEEWEQRYQQMLRGGSAGRYPDAEQSALRRLIWTAGRLQAAKSELLSVVESHPTESRFAAVRIAALGALHELKLTAADLAKITLATQDPDSEVRRAAVSLLAAKDSDQAAQLAEPLLADRLLFARVAASDNKQVAEVAATAAGNVHYQAVVLPLLLTDRDVSTLGQVAADAERPESARLGAIEGLARMGLPAAEKKLVGIGTDESLDEELRKAAWRGLRRSKRLRVKS